MQKLLAGFGYLPDVVCRRFVWAGLLFISGRVSSAGIIWHIGLTQRTSETDAGEIRRSASRYGRVSHAEEKNMAGAIGDAKGVDLNTASEDELERVGGIGRERARRIIENRPLKSWDDLKRIEGFSDKLVEDLRAAGATLGRSEGARA
jgi:predicted flap endonuclease-1-like 5' DNA nuclease